MTDEQIIKELQCASEWFTQHGSNTNTAIIGICGRAVDLINRQKAEIDSLNNRERILIYHIAVERERAIKDFAEAYKEQIKSCTGMFTDDGFYVPLDAVLRIVEFCKEQMIGEQDESIQQEDC